MGIPTLYIPGSLQPLSNKIKKEELDEYVPMHYILEVIRHKTEKTEKNIHDHIFLLKSETGTGKSTAFIVETYRRFLSHDYKLFRGDALEQVKSFIKPMDFDFSIYDFPDDKYTIANRKEGFLPVIKRQEIIACTQPKVLTAVSKAKEIAMESYNPDMELGVNIGYSTGNFKMSISERKGVKFATLGSFVQSMKIRSDKEIMETYVMIMIDECHITSKELYVGMAYIRTFLRKNAGNPMCPLFIFMSATFDVKLYGEFLGTHFENSVLVRGSESKYEKQFHEEYLKLRNIDRPAEVKSLVEETYEKAIWLHENNKNDDPSQADILIFVPGMSANEGRGILKMLQAYEHVEEYIIYELNSQVVDKNDSSVAKIESMKLDEVKKIEGKPKAIRRITITTNVAETGITIKALKYVIDTGLNKTMLYSPNHRLKYLVSKNVTRSAVEQRMGRVGRDFYGYAYAMYSEELYKQLPEYEQPDMYRMDVSKDLIDLMFAKIGPEYIKHKMDFDKFVKFMGTCIDPAAPLCSKANDNCGSVYVNHMIKDSQLVPNPNFYESEEITDHPVELLTKMPQDLYVSCISKITMLGFNGTYAGYLASRMNRSSIEGCRMMITAMGYGVSISDAATMSILMDSQFDYRVEFRDSKSLSTSKVKYPMFSYRKILTEFFSDSPSVLKEFCFGNVQDFIDMVQDDLIEGLIVFRYVVKLMRSITPAQIASFKPTRPHEQKTNRAPSMLNVLERKCYEVGINLMKMRHMLINRVALIAGCVKLGINNIHPEVEFGKDIANDIARIKRCIYSGLKCNTLTKEGKKYKTSTGVLLSARTKAKHVLYTAIKVMPNPQSIMFDVSAVGTCSMDGWI